MKEKILKQKNIRLIIIVVLSVLIILASITFCIKVIKNNNIKENPTTKLVLENDFLNWFIDFDNLYNKKVKSPKYSLKKDVFEKLCDYLNKNDMKIYFKDNTYFLDNETLELDVNNSSFRYTKYNNDKKVEILEVTLVNGKYYVQLINSQYIYKIHFNKDRSCKRRIKNKSNLVMVSNSIYGVTDFEW